MREMCPILMILQSPSLHSHKCRKSIINDHHDKSKNYQISGHAGLTRYTCRKHGKVNCTHYMDYNLFSRAYIYTIYRNSRFYEWNINFVPMAVKCFLKLPSSNEQNVILEPL